MKITIKDLIGKNACLESREWYSEHGEETAEKTIGKLMRQNKYDWAVWGITHALDKKDNILFAIYCAEQVIKLFDAKYPDDNRPREAIKAAKAYLKNPSHDAAYYAANAANYAANYAAVAANYAANAANYAAAANDVIKQKIVRYGIKLIKRMGKK